MLLLKMAMKVSAMLSVFIKDLGVFENWQEPMKESVGKTAFMFRM